jgi:hypothetical protein
MRELLDTLVKEISEIGGAAKWEPTTSAGERARVIASPH